MEAIVFSSGDLNYQDYSEPDDEQDNEPKTPEDKIQKLESENQILSFNLNRLEEETSLIRAMFNKANGELENLKKPALLVAEIVTILNEENASDKAVTKLPNGNKFYSYVSDELKGKLNAGDSVLMEQKSLNIIKKIELSDAFEVEKYVIVEKPKESWKEIGGLKETVEELKEVIELPLKRPKLFEKVGITPPKGVLLHGPPGTGKTLLAKAVANSTDATFIEVVGSELVQKFIGEGAKLVKEIFSLARRKAPAIIFIDEIDALAATRMETGTSGEREVSRTFMQLLAELDGFEPLGNIKVIAATNRIDILDNAIIRPGRLDRLIEVGLSDEKGRLEIFKVHTARMNLQNVKLKDIAEATENFSGAEIRAVCTEAGYFAIREKRDHIITEDFFLAIDKVFRTEVDEEEHIFG
ncbi:MAG: AAA family ATPase [Nanoarchaeota archaeon]|nr:AAA family ATPase [Nanoarchaeota archaeon]